MNPSPVTRRAGADTFLITVTTATQNYDYGYYANDKGMTVETYK